MRFSLLSGVRNDLIQEIADNTVPVAEPTSIYNFGSPLQKQMTTTGLFPQHASVTRNTYTVPTGKRALLTSSYQMIYRDISPTGTILAKSLLTLLPSGGSVITMQELQHEENAVRFKIEVHNEFNYVMDAGDVLKYITSDAGTTASTHFTFCATVTEFDV